MRQINAGLPQPQTEAIRSGNRRIFDQLHADLSPRVAGYLQRFTRNKAESEDLTQEVFVAAYVGRQAYNGAAQPIAWLMGIARRHWRGRTRAASRGQVEMPDDARANDDPEAQAVRAAHLESCLNQLDLPGRDALQLVFGQGLTYAEAADILAVSP